MALTAAYLITTKNLEAFLNAIRSAKAPERFTNTFLKQLEFSSSNDRMFIGLMKGLGLTDEAGIPTQRYYQFLDQTESGRVLADAIKEAYEDLFAINKNAHNLTVEEVKNKLRTLTQGQKSDNVYNLMANTFKALCALADWEAPSPASAPPVPLPSELEPEAAEGIAEPAPQLPGHAPVGLHYNIQIHLPESRDPAVFDAIFQALKKHLM